MRLIRSADHSWLLQGDARARLDDLSPSAEDIELALTLLTSSTDPVNETQLEAYHATFLMTGKCDLTCPYCFQNESVGPKMPTRVTTASIADDAIPSMINFLRVKMHEAQRSTLQILLFGGEPLLSFDTCCRLLDQASVIGLTDAAMTTNGTALTMRRLNHLQELGLRAIQVSFDGAREIHDRTRKNHNGRGSYGRILKNLASCRNATDVEWQIRANVTWENITSLPQLVEDIATTLDPEHVKFYLSPVLDAGIYSGTPSLDRETVHRFAAVYRMALDRGLGIHLPPDAAKCVDCGSYPGTTGAVIGPDGSLYSCWESAGRPDMVIGDVHRGYYPSELVDSRWVACGYLSESVNDRDDMLDQVDAELLDLLEERRRLGQSRTVSVKA